MRVKDYVASETELNAELDRLYLESGKGKSFTGILELASNEQTIITAIHNMKSNKGSKTAGIDKKVINNYLQMPYKQLIGLVKSTLAHYNPKPVKRHYIAKKNSNKLRPLGIPVIIDRIVEECLRIVLEPICEAKFFPYSFGFRPYRSTKYAVKNVCHTVRKHPWVIEGDIRGFFDTVNHGLLIKKLHNIGIIDKRILAIIKKMLKSGVFEDGKITETNLGTQQGSILSPLLANVYLNDFDWSMARRWQTPRIKDGMTKDKSRTLLKKHGIKGEYYLTRYADDWIITAETKQKAEYLLDHLNKYFKHKLKIELSEEKTLITNLKEKPAKFLGFNIRVKKRRATHDKPPKETYNVTPNPDRVKQQIRNICDKIHALKKLPRSNHEAIAIQIEKINMVTVGVAEYWRSCVAKRVLCKIDNAIYNSSKAAFRYILGKKHFKNNHIQLNKLTNRPERHAKRKQRTFALFVNDQWIGFTIASATKIEYLKTLFSPKLTPYTQEGRKLHSVITKKTHARDRPPLYSEEELDKIALELRGYYNFEYVMNREYAYNRDKGKCKCCHTALKPGHRHCHHVRPWLPMEQINKVPQLAWLCASCNLLVHGTNLPNDKATAKKITKYRELLINPSK
jgi:group II intron reverse transcriptase/maturase